MPRRAKAGSIRCIIAAIAFYFYTSVQRNNHQFEHVKEDTNQTADLRDLHSHQIVTDLTTGRAAIGHIYLVKVDRSLDSL
jgi:hypothetical protein